MTCCCNCEAKSYFIIVLKQKLFKFFCFELKSGRKRKVSEKIKSKDKWTMQDGGWKMEDGKWRIENGRWRMEDGGWMMDNGRL